MTVKEVIAQIVSNIVIGDSPEAVPAFFYGTDAEKNLEGDGGTFPAIFLDTPVSSEFELLQSGYVQETNPVVLFFCDKIKFDATPAQQELLIREQKQIVKKFIALAQNHEAIREIGVATGEEVFNVFDVNVSGILLKVSITIFNDDSICV